MTDQHPEPVGLSEINTLRRAGVISPNRYLDAVYQCREADFWTRWALRALLALGVGHLLAGVVFFFAYNWNGLPSIAKFAILQGGIVVSAIAALFLSIHRITGQMLLIVTTIFVGTLLAVIGQVYQSGANAYDLFTLWALLTIPFVVASWSAAHWFVWLVIAYLAFILYGSQVLMRPYGEMSIEELQSLLAIATVVILATREIALRLGAEWLAPRWTRMVLAFAMLAFAFFPAASYVLDLTRAGMTVLLPFIAIIAATAIVYVRFLADFAVLAIATGFVALFLMAAGGRLLGETIGFKWDDTMGLISALALLTLWCAAMTAATVKFLTGLRSYMGKGGSDD